jgi:hypothetical protein
MKWRRRAIPILSLDNALVSDSCEPASPIQQSNNDYAAQREGEVSPIGAPDLLDCFPAALRYMGVEVRGEYYPCRVDAAKRLGRQL